MEFPHGHHSHTHHHYRQDDSDDTYPPPNTAPPPLYQPPQDYPPPPQDFPPPPPPVYVSHTSHNYEPPQQDYYYQPPTAQVTHVSHENPHYYDQQPPQMGSFISHQTHESSGFFTDRPSFKVYCKADPEFVLTVRDGKVILARSDSSDLYQSWFKDEKYSTRVKDSEGSPCFSLVNKTTGEAMKHSVGESHPVQLVPYNSDTLDSSILWTESKDLGDGYRAVRMVNNVHLNLDAFHGDEKSGGVHDGTTIVLWKWNKGPNQRWKIVRQ